MGNLDPLVEHRVQRGRDDLVPLLLGPGEDSLGFRSLKKIEKGLQKTYRRASIVDKDFVAKYGNSPPQVERELAERDDVILLFFFIGTGYGVRMEAAEFMPKYPSRCLAFLGPETLRCYKDYLDTNKGPYEVSVIRDLPGWHIKSVAGPAIEALERCNDAPAVIDQVLSAVDLISLASKLV